VAVEQVVMERHHQVVQAAGEAVLVPLAQQIKDTQVETLVVVVVGLLAVEAAVLVL
jgi:hypothetical protein